MTIRVGLFLDRRPDEGGAFQYCRCILNAVASLPRDEYDVLVATPFESVVPLVESRGLKVEVIDRGRAGRALRKLWRMLSLSPRWWYALAPMVLPVERWLDRAGRDLWIFPGQDDVAYRHRLPSIGVIHDLMHRYERRFPEVAEGRVYAWRDVSYSKIAKDCVGVLVDSEVGRRHVMEQYHVDAQKVHPLQFIPPDYIFDPDPLDFGSRFKLPKRFFFYPAQFWEHKNHKGLLRAWKTIDSAYPDVRFVFSGGRDKSFREVLILAEQLRLKDKITFAGYVPDEYMAGFYRRARALFMPTFFGPTNIPPLEAIALGCPVAISGIYGMPEQLGDAALFFSPESTEEMADALVRLWCDDHLCSDLSRRGRVRSKLFSQHAFDIRLREILDCALLRSGK